MSRFFVTVELPSLPSSMAEGFGELFRRLMMLSGRQAIADFAIVSDVGSQIGVDHGGMRLIDAQTQTQKLGQALPFPCPAAFYIARNEMGMTPRDTLIAVTSTNKGHEAALASGAANGFAKTAILDATLFIDRNARDIYARGIEQKILEIIAENSPSGCATYILDAPRPL